MYEQNEVTDFALGHNIVDNFWQVCGFVCGHVDENFDGECDECKKPDILAYSTIKIDTVGSVIVGDGESAEISYVQAYEPQDGAKYHFASFNDVVELLK